MLNKIIQPSGHTGPILLQQMRLVTASARNGKPAVDNPTISIFAISESSYLSCRCDTIGRKMFCELRTTDGKDSFGASDLLTN